MAEKPIPPDYASYRVILYLYLIGSRSFCILSDVK